MKFEINNIELLSAVNTAKKCIGSKQPLQILSNIKLEIRNNKLNILATNTELSILVEKNKLKIDTIGATTVHAEKLSKILKTFDNLDLCLELKNNFLYIQAVEKDIKTKHKIATIDAEDYPHIINNNQNREYIEIESQKLKDGFDRCIYAVSQDDGRYHLKSIQLKIENEKLIMNGTDGRRLGRVETYINTVKENIESVIPYKTAKEISEIIDRGSVCYLSITKDKIYIKYNETTVISNLIQTNYPNVEQILPTSEYNICSINKYKLRKSFERVISILSKDTVTLRLDIEKGLMILKANNSDYGESRDELDCLYDGEPKSIGINYLYLKDLLSILRQDNVHFTFYKNQLPIKIEEDLEEMKNINIIMPMKLEN